MTISPVLASSVITMMRNITGRTDSSDPAFSDTIMLQYLNDFIQTDACQDVRLFEDQTWYEFNLTASVSEYSIDLDALGYSTIQPPAYVGGFEVFWYQSPTEFYRVWPETQTFQEQRPTYILWNDNKLTFRGPPDDAYAVKISANKIRGLETTGSSLEHAYLDRYYAYGASLNILSDYCETERYQQVLAVFKKHRANLLARTWQQNINQRITPEF